MFISPFTKHILPVVLTDKFSVVLKNRLNDWVFFSFFYAVLPHHSNTICCVEFTYFSVHVMPVFALLLQQCAKLQLEQRSACTELCTVNMTSPALKHYDINIVNNAWKVRVDELAEKICIVSKGIERHFLTLTGWNHS